MTVERKALILFAHPSVKGSRAGRTLRDAVASLPGVTVHDLYATYPDFLIDVRREQELLTEHDLVVLQHPFYWNSCPPLLKLWLDDVLEHGWAYGEKGMQLKGKTLWTVVTAGGPSEAYREGGANRFEMRTLLSPFDQTAHLCGMRYPEPLIVHGVGMQDDVALAHVAQTYRQAILRFVTLGVGP